jgi:protein gp37
LPVVFIAGKDWNCKPFFRKIGCLPGNAAIIRDQCRKAGVAFYFKQ